MKAVALAQIESPVPTCLAIGNFDGVHRGHAALVATAIARARALGVAPAVLTFDPHPAAVLGRGAPARLTSLERKLELLHELGVEHVFALAFDRETAKTPASLFATEALFGRLQARAVVVGASFRFGEKRRGDVPLLVELAAPRGIEIVPFDLHHVAGEIVSSSRVRQAIEEGDVTLAAELLARPHRITAAVVHGDARGRTLGFPTANLAEPPEMVPESGVYAVLVHGAALGGEARKGVMNIGMRPTVTEKLELRREVHILDFSADLYGQIISVDFVSRIRDEKKFNSIDELKQQIAMDVDRARSLLAPPA